MTPDSFSDGGRLTTVEQAVARAEELIADGADVLDVGGESTRPGAGSVSADEEAERVIPVIRRLAETGGVPVSVDTTKAEVARAALAAGAEIVNDVSGGVFDPLVPHVCAEAGAAYILGHLAGRSMAEVHEAGRRAGPQKVQADLAQRLAELPPGLRERTLLDPGLGFGKDTDDNVRLSAFVKSLSSALSCAVMVGPSRKRFLGALTGRPVSERDPATIGAGLASVACGAHVVRVHDVRGFKDALTVFLPIWEARVG